MKQGNKSIIKPEAETKQVGIKWVNVVYFLYIKEFLAYIVKEWCYGACQNVL